MEPTDHLRNNPDVDRHRPAGAPQRPAPVAVVVVEVDADAAELEVAA
ncbi:hypothetical protein KSP35_17870 [Aquihabitans sp. G128]|nr:hypothetical protein [Aquihabitans sp. G128]QXC60197.1 hypothetical protein KSP35_17870 [Aquihabitans sp. G128]